jgi:hypothetical protein
LVWSRVLHEVPVTATKAKRRAGRRIFMTRSAPRLTKAGGRFITNLPFLRPDCAGVLPYLLGPESLVTTAKAFNRLRSFT